jgi:hypothetical protein
MSNVDFEALWIELHFNGKQNLLCGIMYRHPNGNLDNFMDYINQTIEQIHQENQCWINLMAEAAYAADPALLGALRF